MKLIDKLLMGAVVVLAFANCNNATEKISSGTNVVKDAADAIYYGGDILTMEGDSATYAEAVAVKNGNIVFTGSKADAETLPHHTRRCVSVERLLR